jgi:PAS domain S-box-containing protein
MHDMTESVAESAAAIPPFLARKLQSWDSLVDRLPIGVYTCDSSGRILQFNRRAAELWGRAPLIGSESCERFCGAHRLFRRDGSPLPHAETPMAEVLRTGRAVRDGEVVLRRPDGSEITVLVNIDPLFDEDGRLVGAVNCFQDISRRVEAERRLAERERWYHGLLEALPTAVYTTDAAGRITFYNEAAAEFWGCRPLIGSAEWCGSWRLYRTDGTPLQHDECPMAIALKERRPVRGAEAVAERPDGTRVPFMPFPTPLFDEEGRLVGGVNMLVDLTRQKRDQAALAEEARRLKVLLDELNHRVKNTLATVQSLASQTFRDGSVPAEVREAFEGRLQALSRTHTQLSRGGWEAAELCALLEDLFRPYRLGGEERIRMRGTPVRLPAQTALILAMVLHELAANAAKYGALSRPEGRLDVSWSVDLGGRLGIAWTERGGPPVSAPARRGFGSRLLEHGIKRQLQGSADIDFAPAGVRCTIALPLAVNAA